MDDPARERQDGDRRNAGHRPENGEKRGVCRRCRYVELRPGQFVDSELEHDGSQQHADRRKRFEHDSACHMFPGMGLLGEHQPDAVHQRTQ